MINLYKFTKAEINVLELAAQGYSISYIADKLCITKSTVSTHLQNIYDKYGLKQDKTYNRAARATFLFMRGEK